MDRLLANAIKYWSMTEPQQQTLLTLLITVSIAALTIHLTQKMPERKTGNPPPKTQHPPRPQTGRIQAPKNEKTKPINIISKSPPNNRQADQSLGKPSAVKEHPGEAPNNAGKHSNRITQSPPKPEIKLSSHQDHGLFDSIRIPIVDAIAEADIIPLLQEDDITLLSRRFGQILVADDSWHLTSGDGIFQKIKARTLRHPYPSISYALENPSLILSNSANLKRSALKEGVIVLDLESIRGLK
jgi:hypothetical protein